MNIFEIVFNNAIFQGAFGTIATLAAWKMINVLYDFIQVNSLIKSNMKKLGNFSGLKMWNSFFSKIKDNEVREKLIKGVDEGVTEFDKGFDMGIRGIKL